MQEVQTVISAHAYAKRDELVESSLEFAHRIVWSMIKKYNLRAESYDELHSAALFGLVTAAERFDPERGGDFKSFALLRVRGAVIDHLRSTFVVSGRAYKALQAQQKAQEVFEHVTVGRRTARGDDDDVLGRLYDTASSVGASYALSYCDVMNPHLEDEFENNPEELLVRKQRVQILLKALDKLPKRERKVIEEYYFHDKSLAEIVEEGTGGVTRSWLSRIHSKALSRLKKHMAMLSAEYSRMKDEEE